MNPSWSIAPVGRDTWRIWIALAATLVILPAASRAEGTTNAPPANSFEAFKLITQRNIFDPNRRSGEASRRRLDPAALARAEGFSLAGVGINDNVPTAFFVGTSSKYQKTLHATNSIADYQIVEIGFDHVDLQAGTNLVKLPVGMQMKRLGDGDWQLMGGTATLGAATPTEASAPAPSSANAGADAVLKRLMQQREQELKK